MALNVDSNYMLQPLGLKVFEDKRRELLPPIELITESIPGRHGVLYFGFKYKPRPMELVVGRYVQTGEEVESVAKAFLTQVASQISPFLGEQELTYADEPGKIYNVVITGTSGLTIYADYVELSIQMQMNACFIVASSQSSLTGSGIALNNGNAETSFVLEIVGPVTNPSVVVGTETMTYTGVITASDKLIVDTSLMTATFNGADAMLGYNGVFPKLTVGNNIVTAAAGGTTTIKWYNRWQ